MLIGASRKRFIGTILGELGCSEGFGRAGFFGVDVYFFSPMCSNPKEVLEQLGFYPIFLKKIGTYFSATLRNRGIGIYFSATFWGRETQVYSWFSL